MAYLSIYLGGKTGGEKFRQVDGIKGVLVYATDGCNHSEHNFGFGYGSLAEMLEYSPKLVKDSLLRMGHPDFFVGWFNCDSCFGTAAELAYFAGKNIPCHALFVGREIDLETCDKHQTEQPDTWKDRYWFAASLPGVTSHCFPEPKDARKWLRIFCMREAHKRYLNSPEWQERSNRAKSIAGYKCQRCPSKINLHVHHLTYERWGEEPLDDLCVLCALCHRDAHFRNPEWGDG
jgi:hypothetical protein